MLKIEMERKMDSEVGDDDDDREREKTMNWEQKWDEGILK